MASPEDTQERITTEIPSVPIASKTMPTIRMEEIIAKATEITAMVTNEALKELNYFPGMHDKLQELQTNGETCQAELSQALREKKRLEEENLRLFQDNTSLTNEVNSYMMANKELQMTNTRYAQANQAFAQQQPGDHDRMQKLTHDNYTLSRQVDYLKGIIATHENTSSTPHVIKQLKEQVEQKNRDIVRLQTVNSAYTAQLQTHGKQHGALSTEFQRLQRAYNVVVEKLNQLGYSIVHNPAETAVPPPATYEALDSQRQVKKRRVSEGFQPTEQNSFSPAPPSNPIALISRQVMGWPGSNGPPVPQTLPRPPNAHSRSMPLKIKVPGQDLSISQVSAKGKPNSASSTRAAGNIPNVPGPLSALPAAPPFSAPPTGPPNVFLKSPLQFTVRGPPFPFRRVSDSQASMNTTAGLPAADSSFQISGLPNDLRIVPGPSPVPSQNPIPSLLPPPPPSAPPALPSQILSAHRNRSLQQKASSEPVLTPPMTAISPHMLYINQPESTATSQEAQTDASPKILQGFASPRAQTQPGSLHIDAQQIVEQSMSTSAAAGTASPSVAVDNAAITTTSATQGGPLSTMQNPSSSASRTPTVPAPNAEVSDSEEVPTFTEVLIEKLFEEDEEDEATVWCRLCRNRHLNGEDESSDDLRPFEGGSSDNLIQHVKVEHPTVYINQQDKYQAFLKTLNAAR